MNLLLRFKIWWTYDVRFKIERRIQHMWYRFWRIPLLWVCPNLKAGEYVRIVSYSDPSDIGSIGKVEGSYFCLPEWNPLLTNVATSNGTIIMVYPWEIVESHAEAYIQSKKS